MIGFVALLLFCQLIGEVVAVATAIPVPGPVIGMVVLFVGLSLRGSAPAGLTAVAGGLLQHLSLLFVPAGVGIMVHLALIAQEWLPITVALVVSTAAGLVATALLMAGIERLQGGAGTRSHAGEPR